MIPAIIAPGSGEACGISWRRFKNWGILMHCAISKEWIGFAASGVSASLAPWDRLVRWLSGVYLIPWVALFVSLATPTSAQFLCPNGAEVDAEPKCAFFVVFENGSSGKVVDSRISERITKSSPDDAPVRSFALVISISAYPKFKQPSDRFLAPAKNDLKNLTTFLMEQKFDEIILLENENATKLNIDYFLDVYLNAQLDNYKKRARVLVAFTGHGAAGDTPADPGSLVLGDASYAKDYPNIYRLSVLAPKLTSLATKSYHFIALLGSCYSGGVFPPLANGGDNSFFPSARGAHAVSATKADDLAYGLDESAGSIFFDTLIAGVRSGNGDHEYAGWVSLPNGDLHMVGGGIVRLGALAGYVSAQVDRLSLTRGKSFPQLLFGNLGVVGTGGAFFFLGPEFKVTSLGASNLTSRLSTGAVSDSGNLSAAIAKISTGSAVAKNPEIKVFRPPDIP